MAPNGPGVFYYTNPDVADVLGRTDFDFEMFHVLDFFGFQFPDFQIPDFQISRNLAWAKPGLGRAGPSPLVKYPEFVHKNNLQMIPWAETGIFLFWIFA